MRNAVLLAVLLSIPAAARAQAPAPAPAAPNPATVRKAIDARNLEWTTAANRGDVKAIAKIYDANAMIIPPASEAMTGTANIESVFGGMIKTAKNLKFETKSLDVNGGYAYELGLATFDATGPDGKVTKASARYLVIWKLGKDGVWYYHLDAWWSPTEHAH